MRVPEGLSPGGQDWESKGIRLTETIAASLAPSLKVEGSVVVARVGGTNVQYLRTDISRGGKTPGGLVFQRAFRPAPLLTIVSYGGRSPVQDNDAYQGDNPLVKKVSRDRVARQFAEGEESRTLLTLHPPDGFIAGADIQEQLEQGGIQRYPSLEEYEKAIAEWQGIFR